MPFSPRLGHRHNLDGLGCEPANQGLDGLGDRLRGRAAGGRGELDAVILRGVMTGGDVDAAGPPARSDGEAHHRGGAIPLGEIADNAVAGHHFRRRGGKGLGAKAGVVADYHPLVGQALLLEISGDGLADQAGIGKGEIFGVDAAPAGGAEFDCRHINYLAFLKQGRV